LPLTIPRTDMKFLNFFNKNKEKEKEEKEALNKGLERTKQGFFDKLSKAVIGKSKVDEEVLDELENILVASDVGVATTIKIIRRIEERVARDKYTTTKELDRILKEEITTLLTENKTEDLQGYVLPTNIKPYVIMVVGVNGVGKTTTIGKLAHNFHQQGYKVVLGAGDTFRAAAVEQLQLWGQRVGVPVIEHGMNTDPSAVAYDAVKQGVETGADVVIVDTAGRLHTKVGLMNELSKIKRVMQKISPETPHEILLVLDGSTGQNAFIQAQEFTKATEVTSLAITKLDGTAKGGVVIGISDQFRIPVKYIGVGERMEDLQVFNRKEFVDSLFQNTEE
jgi:fused signal recognition particle receptor